MKDEEIALRLVEAWANNSYKTDSSIYTYTINYETALKEVKRINNERKEEKWKN